VQVKDGGLANVVVHVKNASGTYAAPTQAVELVHRGCEYHPHVIALQAGQPLRIVNDDDTLHNVHPIPHANEEWNLPQPQKGASATRVFDKPELLFPMSCDVHPWMRAWISVLGNPFFAVSREDGSFEIRNLPAGDYEVEAVHEALKSQTQKVSVKDGEAARLDFTFTG
jgi:plastocyanin